MAPRRLIASLLSRRSLVRGYALALGVAAVAVLCRALLAAIAPGIAYLVVLLPAVAIAGVFWGTGPAVVAALAGMGTIGGLSVEQLAVWPPFNSTQIDVLAFVPACIAVLWAADAARRSAANAAAAEGRLRAAIDAGSLGLWELDLVSQRVRLDATLAAMLGMPREPVEIERKDMTRFAHPANQVRARAVFTSAIASGAPYADELRMLTVQGEERWFVTRGATLQDQQTVVGVMRDVTQRRAREESLRAALDARDILMREADHRIKNSLQLVSSLLQLQLGRVDDPDARAALEAALARVTAVADAHLALQSAEDLKTIEIDRMLGDLCGRVGLLNPAVSLECRASSGLWLDAELAIPLALIASELLTNALRHAFPPGSSGEVTLTAAANDGMFAMTIADGGVGLPPTPVRRSLGTTVLAALARQIEATMTTHSQPGSGTAVTLRLELPTTSEVADTPLRKAAGARDA